MSADDRDSALDCELLPESHRNFGPPGQRGMFTAPCNVSETENLTPFDIVLVFLTVFNCCKLSYGRVGVF